MIFCYGEGSLFPESDFLHTDDGKLYVPYIHHVQPEHWATIGQIINPLSLDGVVFYNKVAGIIKIDLSKEEGPAGSKDAVLPELPEAHP